MGQVHSEINGFDHSNNFLGKHKKPLLEPIGDWYTVNFLLFLGRGCKYLGYVIFMKYQSISVFF